MTKSKERFGGMVINWATIFVQIIISLFFVPFFLKTVGDKQYGLYSFSISLITWLDVLMVAVASAYFKFLTREKKKAGEYGEARACGVFFKIFLLISLFILVVGFIFDLLLYFGVVSLNQYSGDEKNQICIILLFSIVSTVLTCLLTVRKSYQFYKQKYILIYSFYLAQILIQTGLSVFFLKRGFDVVAVAVAHCATALFFKILLSVFSKIFLKQKVSVKSNSPEDKKYRKQLFIEIMVFSCFVIMNTIIDTLNRTLDKTILGFYNADAIANYQLAYTFPAYLISFTSIVSVVYDQHLNNAYYNGGGINEMNKIFLKVSKIQTIFSFFLIGGFIACGKEFVFLWLDDTRTQVYIIGCILMFTYSITCCNSLSVIARRIRNFHIKASFIYVGIAVFNVLLSLALVNVMPRENAIWACVIGTVITYLLGHWIVMQLYDKKITGLDIWSFFKSFLKFLVIALTIDLVVIRFVGLLEINNTIVSFLIKGGIFVLAYIIAVSFVEKELIGGLVLRVKSIAKRLFRKKINTVDYKEN